MLSKEERAARAQNSRNFSECLVGTLDRAKNQGGHHGVDARVVEWKLLCGGFDDSGIQRQQPRSLPKLRCHVRIRFGQEEF
jgi:hypothetical protein